VSVVVVVVVVDFAVLVAVAVTLYEMEPDCLVTVTEVESCQEFAYFLIVTQLLEY
jgi:hypothetical protein